MNLMDALFIQYPSLAWIQAAPALHAAIVWLLACIAAWVFERLLWRSLGRWTARTATLLDDRFHRELQTPVSITLLLLALRMALRPLHLEEGAERLVISVLVSVGVLVWGARSWRLGIAVLHHLARQPGEDRPLQARTLPVFDLGWKAFVLTASAYFLMGSWHVDLTAWVASAGVAGIAIGLAAQETLSNLFAGLAILTDAPYRPGDFLVLDDGTRGRVREIGLRSTRILTNDDVQVVLPNAMMASARIMNESAGPSERERVTVRVGVAYDSDLERVRRVLLEVAADCSVVIQDDPTRRSHVRFKSFDDSAISVALHAWIARPEQLEFAVDALIVGIHTAFRDRGVVIPFPQVDVGMRDAALPVVDG